MRRAVKWMAVGIAAAAAMVIGAIRAGYVTVEYENSRSNPPD